MKMSMLDKSLFLSKVRHNVINSDKQLQMNSKEREKEKIREEVKKISRKKSYCSDVK